MSDSRAALSAISLTEVSAIAYSTLLPSALLGNAKVAFLAETSERVKLRLTIRLPSVSKQNREIDDSDFFHASVVEVGSKKVRVVFGPSVNDTVTCLFPETGEFISYVSSPQEANVQAASMAVIQLFI